MRHAGRTWPLTVGLLLAACGGEPAAREPFVTRDSAGIRIAESSAPAWSDGTSWSIDTAPILTIGGETDDSASQLYGVRGAVRLGDGTIVVANGGTAEVRYYDASGAFLGAAGGRGEGPGEFAFLASLLRIPGDTVVALDAQLQRVTTLGPRGALLRERVLPRGPRMQVLGMTPGGVALAAYARTQARPEPGVNTISALLVLHSPGPAPSDTLGEFPVLQVFQPEGASDFAATPMPFGLRTVFDVADRIYLSLNDALEIRVLSEVGEVEALIRLHRAAEPMADGQLAAERRRIERVARMRDDQKRMLIETLDAIPRPDVLPPLDEIIADALHHLWVRRFHGNPELPQRWMVLDPDGRWLGDVTLPGDVEVLEIGADYMLVLRRDDLDVERVEMFGLVRAVAP